SPVLLLDHTATAELYTLSLHDALPILAGARSDSWRAAVDSRRPFVNSTTVRLVRSFISIRGDFSDVQARAAGAQGRTDPGGDHRCRPRPGRHPGPRGAHHRLAGRTHAHVQERCLRPFRLARGTPDRRAEGVRAPLRRGCPDRQPRRAAWARPAGNHAGAM